MQTKSSVKPKERKVKCPNSDEAINKIFTKFAENTPETHCQWICNMEEYIHSRGITTTPAANFTASHQQLLGQAHTSTAFDNCASTSVVNCPVTTEAEFKQTYATSGNMHIDGTAWRNQKR
jgi:hypothetical protein